MPGAVGAGEIRSIVGSTECLRLTVPECGVGRKGCRAWRRAARSWDGVEVAAARDAAAESGVGLEVG